MKYFFDTEFIEGPQDKTLFGFKYGETKPTIDLISIGMVSESGREYYAISKDFNLKQAWNNEWIRNNVLLPIYKENISGDWRNRVDFSLKGMNHVIEMVGKTNEEIAREIMQFVLDPGKDILQEWIGSLGGYVDALRKMTCIQKPEFYAYYADYDWVVFCQLFGTMMDLPKSFPMYCKDLKQLMDDKVQEKYINNPLKPVHTFDYGIEWLKGNSNYPKQENEHNALDDARWNKKLYNFLTTL